MVIFHGYVSHNQMVIDEYFWESRGRQSWESWYETDSYCWSFQTTTTMIIFMIMTHHIHIHSQIHIHIHIQSQIHIHIHIHIHIVCRNRIQVTKCHDGRRGSNEHVYHECCGARHDEATDPLWAPDDGRRTHCLFHGYIKHQKWRLFKGTMWENYEKIWETMGLLSMDDFMENSPFSSIKFTETSMAGSRNSQPW